MKRERERERERERAVKPNEGIGNECGPTLFPTSVISELSLPCTTSRFDVTSINGGRTLSQFKTRSQTHKQKRLTMILAGSGHGSREKREGN